VKEQSLSDKEIEDIINSWNELQKKGEAMVSKVLFKNIFHIAPETLNLFSFKDSENWQTDPRFLQHGVTVVTTIGKVVASLSNLDELDPILIDLGETLADNAVLPDHYPVFAQALMNTLKAALKQKFTPEISSAWNNL
jgi:hemoglobin-like flavoprotein